MSDAVARVGVLLGESHGLEVPVDEGEDALLWRPPNSFELVSIHSDHILSET
jgi:hypothetical protein